MIKSTWCINGEHGNCVGSFADRCPCNCHKEHVPQHASEADLRTWWSDQAQREADMVIPKSVEYGANSLVRLGQTLGRLAGREVSHEEAIELGIWIYVLGKVERWTDAVLDGRRPKDDIPFDIGIYAKMAQRNREKGSWPG